jgi:hypothetical protein
MAQKQVKAPYVENYDYGIGVDLAAGSSTGRVVNRLASASTDDSKAMMKRQVK